MSTTTATPCSPTRASKNTSNFSKTKKIETGGRALSLPAFLEKHEEEKNDLIGPTFFEKVQEEKSIISYDELIKANLNPDELDSYIKEDEGNEPITLEELYKNNANEDFNETEEVSLKSQTEEIKEIKKFKNSSIISPVFGIKNENEKVNMYQTSNVKNIEYEIQKTEEILDELKKLKERIEK